MKPRNFFDLLRSKIFHTPDRNFDQRFWQKFDSEFGANQKPSFVIRWKWSLAFGTAALVAMILFQPRLRSLFQEPTLMKQAQETHVQDILEKQDLLEDIDLFLEFDELAVADEDWDFLLEEKSSQLAPIKGDES